MAPTPSTLAQRGTSGEGYFAFFAPVQTGITTAGVLRLPSASATVIAANSFYSPGSLVQLLSLNGSDGVVVGDPTQTLSVSLSVGYSNAFLSIHGTVGTSFADPVNGITISGSPFVTINGSRFFIGRGAPSQFIVQPRTWGLSNSTPFPIDFDAFGGNPDFTLTANATLSASTNVVYGGRYVVTVRQGSGGPYTLAWDPSFKFGTQDSTVTPSVGAVDIFQFIGDSTGNLLCVGASKNVLSTGNTKAAPVYRAKKTIDFSTATILPAASGSYVVVLFQLNGAVTVSFLAGIIRTPVGTHSGSGFFLDAGASPSTIASPSSTALTGLPAGSIIDAPGTSTSGTPDAVRVVDATLMNAILPPSTGVTTSPFLLVQQFGATTTVLYNFVYSGLPVGVVDFFIDWSPIGDTDTLVPV